MPNRVLVLEKSSTMRYSIMRQLKGQSIEADSLSNFDEALHHIRRSDDLDVIILGWPKGTSADVDDILVLLESASFHEIAVVIISEESDPARRTWVTRRPKSALLSWDSIHELVECITTLTAASKKTDRRLPQGEKGIRILLVDDSPTIRVTYSKLLTGYGYDVEAASNVDEGFNKALASHFDLAIVDYFMPGQTGDVLVKRLSENLKTQSIVTSILTGTYLDKVIHASLDAGAVECMFKSEAQELFLARVESMSRSVIDRRVIETERRHLEGLLNSVGDGVYGVDNQGQITFMNPVAKSILGLPESYDVIGRHPHPIFHHSIALGQPTNESNCFLTKAYHSGKALLNWHTLFWTQGGRSFPVEGTLYPLNIENERQGSVVAFRDITERKLMEEELRWQANHDSLTKLLNRHYFEEELAREVHRVARSKKVSVLLMIDLDQFKYINDTAGHTAGDQLLVQVSQCLSSRVRRQDTLARLGGDEFAIILRDMEVNQVQITADKFCEVLTAQVFHYDEKPYSINGSIGIALIDHKAQSPGEVLAHADVAVHIAKEKGRNQAHIYTESDQTRQDMGRDLGWSSLLKAAIETDNFDLVFQPIFSSKLELTNTDKLKPNERWDNFHTINGDQSIEYEALIRLPNDDGGHYLPGAFLSSAERFNLMPAIDRIVIKKCIAYLASDDGWFPHKIAINLSAQTLVDPKLADDIVNMIEQHQVNPSQLVFEITETTAITNVEAAQLLISRLRNMGCQFSLDDFGIGFSSFGQLKNLDVDFIKIDGLFIKGLLNDPLDREVVLAITQIAHSLGKKTVAEFVETEEILKIAYECGVDYIQGYCAGVAQPWESIPRH